MVKKAVGIDIGGTYVKGALVDERGVILVKDQIPTHKEDGFAEILRNIAAFVQRLAVAGGATLQDLVGVGVGIPGFIDDREGSAVEVINVGWRQVPLRAILANALGLSIWMENDANAAALGESWIGAGRGAESLLCVTLGTGVGGGIVLQQRVWRGTNHMAGELGHFVVDPDGVPCKCGKRGCLETFASATGMLRLAREGLERGEPSVLMADRLSTIEIFDAAANGDALAAAVVMTAADKLGRGLAYAADLLNPEVIIIVGGVAQAGEALLAPVRTAFARDALRRVAAATRLVSALLGNDAGVVGAAKLAFQSEW